MELVISEKVLKICYFIFVVIGFFIPIRMIASNLFRKFNENSMSFTVDTAYLNWNTSFPSISICEIYNNDKNFNLTEIVYGQVPNLPDLLSEVTFFAGTCYMCELCFTNMTCPENLTEVVSIFRSRCQNFIKNCFWNDILFDCCDGFLPLSTENGVCYTINSALTKPKYGKELYGNREIGPGKISMVVTDDIQIFMHHPHDVPFEFGEKDLHENLMLGSTKEYVIKVTEILNDPIVATVPIERRRCRFSWEAEDSAVYETYSFSTCNINCYSIAQVDHCNCTHHLMPRNNNMKAPICDFEGLICLTTNFVKISEVRKNNCTYCLHTCEEFEYKIINNSNEDMENEEITEITISMMSLPTHRYVRRIVTTNMDFMISIGGMFGLFFGISFIRILELLYKTIIYLINHI